MAITPARESQEMKRDRMHRGVRGRSFDVLLGCFAGAIGAKTAALLRCDESGRVEVASTWMRQGRDLTAPGAAAYRALETEEPLVEQADGNGRLAVACPIVGADGSVAGAIHAEVQPGPQQTREELAWAAGSYARLAALCLSRDVTLPAVLASVGFDALTGCLSYAGIVEVLESEIERSRRGKHSLCCCVIGLEGLARVSENGGTLSANHFLNEVGAALKAEARPYDAVGRLRHEEFVLVLPEMSGHAARRVGERFLAGVQSIVLEGPSEGIDASVGVEEWDRQTSAIELLDSARELMMQARNDGGGRVTWRAVEGQVTDPLSGLTRQLMRPWGEAQAAGDGWPPSSA